MRNEFKYLFIIVELTTKEKIEICISDFKLFFRYSLWNKKYRYIGNTLKQEFLDCFDSFRKEYIKIPN